MARVIKNGAKIVIKAKDHYLNGEWAIVRNFDGEYYHVAAFDGDEVLIFSRSEI